MFFEFSKIYIYCNSPDYILYILVPVYYVLRSASSRFGASQVSQIDWSVSFIIIKLYTMHSHSDSHSHFPCLQSLGTVVANWTKFRLAAARESTSIYGILSSSLTSPQSSRSVSQMWFEAVPSGYCDSIDSFGLLSDNRHSHSSIHTLTSSSVMLLLLLWPWSSKILTQSHHNRL